VIDGDGHVIEVNETYERIDPQDREHIEKATITVCDGDTPCRVNP